MCHSLLSPVRAKCEDISITLPGSHKGHQPQAILSMSLPFCELFNLVHHRHLVTQREGGQFINTVEVKSTCSRFRSHAVRLNSGSGKRYGLG